MKHSKKLLALLMALVMSLTLVFTVAYAEDPAVELKAEKDGETMIVTVVAKEDLSFGGFAGNYTYDDAVFTFKSVEVYEGMNEPVVNPDEDYVSADTTPELTVSAGEVLLTLTFDITGEIEKNTDYKFGFTFTEAYDFDLEDYAWATGAVEDTYRENVYTVTFDTDGGSKIDAQEVEENGTATKPADPTKDGYTFKGWQLDGKDYDFATPVTADITLKAVWEKVEEPAPEQPTNPEQPANPEKPGDESPKTGDSTDLALWGSLLVVSALGAAAVVTVVTRKKGKREI